MPPSRSTGRAKARVHLCETPCVMANRRSTRRSHGLRHEFGGQAVDAARILKRPVLAKIVHALLRPVANQTLPVGFVLEQWHAEAARRLHQVDRQANDLPRSR